MDVKWFLNCLKKSVKVIETETGLVMDAHLIERVAKDTAKQYLKEKKADTSQVDPGITHTIMERNNLVNDFKENIQKVNNLGEDRKIEMEFLYEKMLVMADEVDFAVTDTCSP